MNIIIIGTGLAGYLFAKEFRKHNTQAKLTLITKGDGHFYSKPLLSTALSNQKTSDALIISFVETMRAQLNAEVFTRCDVFKIDSQHKKILLHDENHQEKSLHYDTLILTNGADTVQIPLEGDAVDDVLHVNHLEEYRIFRDKLVDKKHVAILGTGLVGCEFANDLIQSGYAVTMIAPDNYVLKKWVPEKVGRALETVLQKAGVQFHLSVFPKKVNHQNNHYEIMLSNDKTIEADVVLSAAGIRSNTALAKTAHLKTNLGICVNAHLQTTDPHIYALGDCAEINGELKMVVASITQNARILAEFLNGKDPVVSHPLTPVAIKTTLCPIVVASPNKDMPGEWKFTEEGANVQALFYDDHNHLRGFALSGSFVKEKMQCIKQMSES
jgi:rubredoxin-NAD+ reductase